MASLPPQASQRRQSPAGPSSSASTSSHEVAQDVAQAQGRSDPTNEENSRLLVVALPMQSATNDAAAADAHAATPKPEPRHCWICLQDEDEEGSDNSAWRSPCPCNLQAHEECMLEWIADLEAPNSRRGRPPSKILCPQCKAEIQVERPRDIIVSTVDVLNKTGRALILPAGFSALFGCLYSGSLVYGLNSLYLVFGSDYVDELVRRHSRDVSIVRKLIGNRPYRFLLTLTEFTDPFMPMSDLLSLEMFLGLPMVAPALILSRTRLADFVFAILPVPLFAIPLAFSSEHRNIRHWPPSPDLAIAVLPYIRRAYNELYRITFAELEKKWDQAVLRKPREGETIEQVAQEADNNGAAGAIGMPLGRDLELVVELGIGEEVPVPHQHVDAQPANPEADQARPNDPRPDANAEPGQQPNGPHGPQADDEWQVAGRDIYPLDVASTVMGALFFPAISSLMGGLLKHTLPRRWVTKPFLLDLIGPTMKRKVLPATGLLQEKWGRSLVGGCLFVVLKDALILYVKWKRARDQGKRRVLDCQAK